MKDYYIVKESVKRGILKPKCKISLEDYRVFIDNNSKFIWLEDTSHGKKWNATRPIKRKLMAHLNYNSEDDNNPVRLLFSPGGYIHVQFDGKVTYSNLLDLFDLVDEINCNLWQINPRTVKVDKEYIDMFKNDV